MDIALRGIVVFGFLYVLTRVIGRRELSSLEPFDLRNQLSSNRTQGIPNMIALIRETAGRLAA